MLRVQESGLAARVPDVKLKGRVRRRVEER